MKKYFFTLHDISEEIIERADSYLRTVIINKKRYYIHKHTKLSRYGITIYELDKFDSNLSYIDNNLENDIKFCLNNDIEKRIISPSSGVVIVSDGGIYTQGQMHDFIVGGRLIKF